MVSFLRDNLSTSKLDGVSRSFLTLTKGIFQVLTKEIIRTTLVSLIEANKKNDLFLQGTLKILGLHRIR